MDNVLSGMTVGAGLGSIAGPLGLIVGAPVGGALGAVVALKKGKTMLLFFSTVHMQKEMTHLFILQAQKIRFSLVKV